MFAHGGTEIATRAAELLTPCFTPGGTAMFQTVRTLAVTISAALLFLAGTGKAQAQLVVRYYQNPTVTYYAAPPVVSSYATPVVSYYTPTVAYYPSTSVSYYAAPTVSYYAAPAVSYYAAPAVTYYPSTVTRTTYGLFGRPRTTTLYYPAVIFP
jgi:hypothetical protein